MSWLVADLSQIIKADDQAAAQASVTKQWTRYGAEHINIRKLSSQFLGPLGASFCGHITYLVFTWEVGDVTDTGSATVDYKVVRLGRYMERPYAGHHE